MKGITPIADAPAIGTKVDGAQVLHCQMTKYDGGLAALISGVVSSMNPWDAVTDIAKKIPMKQAGLRLNRLMVTPGMAERLKNSYNEIVIDDELADMYGTNLNVQVAVDKRP